MTDARRRARDAREVRAQLRCRPRSQRLRQPLRATGRSLRRRPASRDHSSSCRPRLGAQLRASRSRAGTKQRRNGMPLISLSPTFRGELDNQKSSTAVVRTVDGLRVHGTALSLRRAAMLSQYLVDRCDMPASGSLRLINPPRARKPGFAIHIPSPDSTLPLGCSLGANAW